MCQSDNGSITESHPLRRWSNKYIQAHNGLKDGRVPLRLPSLVTGAGFVDVEHRMIPMPLCGWPNGMIEPCSIDLKSSSRSEDRAAIGSVSDCCR